MAKTVLIVHDVLDKPFARQLAIDLSLAGAIVWLDEAETGGIRDFLVGKIEREIRGDVYLAVILSPDSVGSSGAMQEIETAQHRQVSGLTVNVLPLLYKDCTIPAFMADRLCADFRNPADDAAMLRRVIDRLGLGGAGTAAPVLPAALAGIWKGTWIWCGRQRDADLFLSASPAIPSRMVIRYLKSGILTIVDQELAVQVSANAVKLIGTGYRLLERGISLGWNLDTFNLSPGASGMTLEGINTDKRGAQSPVIFQRK